MNIFNVLTLVGGLCLFLFGMNLIIESNFFKKQNMINLFFFKHALYSASSHTSLQMKPRIKMT